MGRGIGAFWNSARIEQYSELLRWEIPHAHNAYLDLVLSVGLVGLLLYGSWLTAAAWKSIILHDRTGSNSDLFLAGLVVFSMVHGIAESKIPGAGFTTLLLYTATAAVVLRGRRVVESRASVTHRSGARVSAVGG